MKVIVLLREEEVRRVCLGVYSTTAKARQAAADDADELDGLYDPDGGDYSYLEYEVDQ